MIQRRRAHRNGTHAVEARLIPHASRHGTTVFQAARTQPATVAGGRWKPHTNSHANATAHNTAAPAYGLQIPV